MRLKRVFALDLEHCPTSGNELKIIATLLERPVIGMIPTRPRFQARALPAGRSTSSASAIGLTLLQVVRVQPAAHLGCTQGVTIPPSTGRVWPVTKDAPGDASHSTALATSSAVPIRPSGCIAVTRAVNASS